MIDENATPYTELFVNLLFMNENNNNKIGVQQRLINAAMQCFLNDDYHRVTTRQIATTANTNVSMIHYYFGNKEGLYEEMIRSTLQPLLDVLESSLLSSADGFSDYFKYLLQHYARESSLSSTST